MIGLLVVQAGCGPVYQEVVSQQSQSIRVTSEPDGALIAVKDEDGVHVVGNAPVDIEETYSVVERTYDKGTCALTGAVEMADVVRGDDGKASGPEAALGLVAMVVGATAGAAVCSEADGVVAVNPKSLAVSASLAGYQTQEVEIEIPKKRPRIHFEMIPAEGGPRPAFPLSAGRPDLVPDRIAVFDLQDSSGNIDQELMTQISAYFTAVLKEIEELPIVIAQRTRECADLSCKIEVARSLSAGLVLDVRVLCTDSSCFVSASLIDVVSQKPRLVAATQTTFDPQGLYAAIDKITDLLTNPPQTGGPE